MRERETEKCCFIESYRSCNYKTRSIDGNIQQCTEVHVTWRHVCTRYSKYNVYCDIQWVRRMLAKIRSVYQFLIRRLEFPLS